MVKQLSLFNQPSLNINKALKEQMATSARESQWSREQILDRMNDLAGRYGVRLLKGNGAGLTMTTLEKWLNVEAMEHIPSINSMVIFCAAVDDSKAMQVLIQPLGAELIADPETKLLLWAKEYQRARKARQKMKRLEEDL